MKDEKIQMFLKNLTINHKRTKFTTSEILIEIREYFSLKKSDTASQYLEFMDLKRYVSLDKGIWEVLYCDTDTSARIDSNKPIPDKAVLIEENRSLFIEIQSFLTTHQNVFEENLTYLDSLLSKYKKNLRLINKEVIK